jgi:signal transduction histidine kinase
MEALSQNTQNRATILIVDDEAPNLTALSSILQVHYRVRAAINGEKALEIATASPYPDLICLDIMMPGMNGLQVMERLRGNPDTYQIPVILITALDSDDYELRGLDKGAVDYVTKPINPSLLLARVRTQLEIKQARDQLQYQNQDLEAEVQRRQKENEHIQLQLLQADKMAAIGQLAAGVVHEINTPLGYVHSNLNTLAGYLKHITEILGAYRSLDPSVLNNLPTISDVRRLEQRNDPDYLLQDADELLTESMQGLERVSAIVQDLKGFSRKSDNEWESADLRQGLDSTINIVWSQLKYHCELHKEYGEIPQIRCLPSQLNQVFLNLLVNAAQAIEDQGHIYLRTGQDDEWVWVEVQDNGSGIAPENLKRLFEPFYTTKPKGQGTGLGLSLSYGIVQRHSGRIEVESEPGQGSVFRVYLPIDPQKEKTAS